MKHEDKISYIRRVTKDKVLCLNVCEKVHRLGSVGPWQLDLYFTERPTGRVVHTTPFTRTTVSQYLRTRTTQGRQSVSDSSLNKTKHNLIWVIFVTFQSFPSIVPEAGDSEM